ncbi:MAG: radical SAM protein [Verrucomicrobiota bacterium]|nr:radical SAM protein [Verrucomicrobiota bacterium]
MAARIKFPYLPLTSLDTLWFQVAGTLCNLRCHHCFISCAPDNATFGLMSFKQVNGYLNESVRYGVKEYYFTGGEPFINADMLRILEATLALGPATVLTNATRFTDEKIERLAQIRDSSIYSLELRVSIDGFSPEMNDPIRGEGTFELAMNGVRLLVAHGFLPIITSMRSWAIEEDERFLAEFKKRLADIGYLRPRMKLLPALKIGQEARRDHGYGAHDFISEEMMAGYDASLLLCHNSRVISDRGVHVCPILVDRPDARLGSTLEDALQGYRLRHQACSTCYAFGALCSNATGVESTVAAGRAGAARTQPS